MKNIAVIGLGNRGSEYMGFLRLFFGRKIKINALCDRVEGKLERYGKRYKVEKAMRFSSAEDFFARGVVADALIIATPDRDHYAMLKTALEVGYKTILVEKPLDKDINKTIELANLTEEKGAKVMVCHVLRYSNFYSKIKREVESGVLGQIISIEQRENVGYFHFAHSYVRGEWHNEAQSSPSLLAKCCHDLDLIYWFAGANPQKVSSRGDLFYFKKENAPEGATEYCMGGCKCKKKCPYDAEAFYITDNIFNATFIRYMPNTVFKMAHPSRKQKREILAKGDYGKCVFLNDNDVCDHQEVDVVFENGIYGKLTMTAFGEKCERETRIVGTKGEIIAKKGKVKRQIYGGKRKTVHHGIFDLPGHVDGDMRTVLAFGKLVLGTLTEDKHFTYIKDTVASHQMAHLAEISRKD